MVFIEEQTVAGASGLRATKEPGDPQWCWQTISYLQGIWQSLSLDYDRYMEAWTEAEEQKVWEKVPYDDPFGTKEEMLHQLAIGDDNQAQRRMKVQPIAKRVRMKHGGDRRSEDFQGSHANLEPLKRGATADYIMERVLELDSSVFERWARGDLSARAAALEVGLKFVERKRTVTLGSNVTRIAEALHSHYGPDDFADLNRKMLQLRRQAGRG